jgi:steroid delta-isomerase-like uncharacterized protein
MTPLELSKENTPSWNKHDGEATTANYTSETVYIHPRGDLKGKEAIRKFLEKHVWNAYPDSQIEIVNIGDVGNGVIASEWIMHATNTGTFGDGSPATGKKVKLPGTTFAQYEGDKVVSERTYFDLHGLFKQLGLV